LNKQKRVFLVEKIDQATIKVSYWKQW